ncbi:hypothetical protein [Paraburkholderia phosphatilytica]|uniref:hypothetical protein n=1 Tax=Paraburkholderia phosphatilytica TaxID=2282883 RepID=UPI000E51F8D4|nr:hypothetical protein [Paraburkholderia phosphatilytica]
MTDIQIPESGALAELAAKVDVLEIALLTALRQQTKQQREDFLRVFDSNISARESINRNTADPLTWTERLAPHAKKLRERLR